MKPVRRDPEHDIARRDGVSRQHPAALHGADREAGEVVVAPGIEAGQFGGFPADQRASGPAAAFGDAGDDVGRHVRLELSGAEIIQKEQRLGAGDDQIVHAHGDEVDADRPVAAGLDGDAQFGADAVGRGDQDRIAVAGFGEVEQAAEAADSADEH